jgi:aminodeoxyfutalosine deaminase
MNPRWTDQFLQALRRLNRPVRIDAAGIYDASSVAIAPGSLLVEQLANGRLCVLAAGRAVDVDSHPASAYAERLDLRREVILPGLVNAHAHLDLTHLGPRPYDPARGFTGWIDDVRRGRLIHEQAIAASVQRGIELSLRAGVVAIGDIAGAPLGQPTLTPAWALADSPIFGTSFIEFFALDRPGPQPEAPPRLEAFIREHEADIASFKGPVRIGLQPHAPYSVSLRGYRWAVEFASRHGLPLATHLAETLAEREYVAHALGPLRTMLEGFGLWHDGLLEQFGLGLHPIEHLCEVMASAPFAAAHVNDADDRALELLARSRAVPVYCPRAHEYFGHEPTLGPHRYREMLALGLPVALGTDSILNLPVGVDAPDGPGLSILEEMRLLFLRDATPARTLLAMATTHALRALGPAFDPARDASLNVGGTPLGLVAVPLQDADTDDPLSAILREKTTPRLLIRASMNSD